MISLLSSRRDIPRYKVQVHQEIFPIALQILNVIIRKRKTGTNLMSCVCKTFPG
jgi:hypothetical protein